MERVTETEREGEGAERSKQKGSDFVSVVQMAVIGRFFFPIGAFVPIGSNNLSVEPRVSFPFRFRSFQTISSTSFHDPSSPRILMKVNSIMIEENQSRLFSSQNTVLSGALELKWGLKSQ